MTSLLNWNDNLVAIFEAKLTFKYQSLSIASFSAFDTTNVLRFESLLGSKSNAMVYELLKILIFNAHFLKKGKLLLIVVLKLSVKLTSLSFIVHSTMGIFTWSYRSSIY